MPKVNENDYLFLSTMLRARESKMLGSDAFERMLAADSLEDAARIAADCGYPEMAPKTVGELDKALSQYRSSIYEELGALISEAELLDAFRIKYDYHNAKAMLKGSALGLEYETLLSDSGRSDIESFSAAHESGDYSDLPGRLGPAMQEASELLARTGNPQLAEFVLDKAYFEDMSALSGGLSGKFLSEYVRLMTDCANLKAAVRTVRMGKGADFLAGALVDGGNLSPGDFISVVQSGGDLSQLFGLSPLAEAAALGNKAMEGGSLTGFELACDNALSSYLDRVSLVPFGADVVAAYLALLDTEITDVRMILSAKLCNVPSEAVKERLRDLNV